MAKNQYWAVKYRFGHYNPRTLSGLRADAIAKYLEEYQNSVFATKNWAWHKRNWGVCVVRVEIVEVGK